ncbi:PBP1A family penicillin-binding protein, partial [Alicyclobacillaceae bacterium I2511]
LLLLRALPLPDRGVFDPTHVDDAQGQRLTEWSVRGTRTERVPLDHIPASLQRATIAVEDVHFYHHHALNAKSVLRALWVNLQAGQVVEGGSTITQQLAKNLYLSQDRTLLRKVREALFAVQLELHETKPQILEAYLNDIYYGHGTYGADAAAHLYFNKPVHHLNLAESAMLAGIPKGPSLYSPFTNWTAAKARQRIVLSRMVTAGFLTAKAADLAYEQPLTLADKPNPELRAPYFTQAAVHEVQQRFHLSTEDLYRGGLSLTTTLDPVLQSAAERAVQTSLPPHSLLQAAVVALDPQTGAVKALVGGRDFLSSPYNRAFAQRQPGSTFKAVLYTAALEHGFTPSRQVNSALTTFIYDHEKTYTVHDYGDVYAHRPLTLREAIARSDNVYAVTTNMEVGPQTVVDAAYRMGWQEPLQAYPALALGVFPASPMEMAAVYACLANGGRQVTPYLVTQVRDATHHQVYQSHPSLTPAVDAQVAFQVTDLLTSVLKPNGTAFSVHSYLHGPAAAKTGTTRSDNWMVGYTPRLVCAVWVGYDDNRPLTLEESHLAAPIWAKLMGIAQQRLPGPWFKPPAGLVACTLDPVTGKLATPACNDRETDYFRVGTQPTEFCSLHPVTHTQSRPFAWRQWWAHWF